LNGGRHDCGRRKSALQIATSDEQAQSRLTALG
jgi:hypothetical protein